MCGCEQPAEEAAAPSGNGSSRTTYTTGVAGQRGDSRVAAVRAGKAHPRQQAEGGPVRRFGCQRHGVLLSCHPKSRTVRKKADQPTNPNHPGVRGVSGLTNRLCGESRGLPNKENSAAEMPTRISLRRVEEPPRASSWPYPVRWPNFSRMRRRLENAPLLVGLKPRSKCSNQSFGRGASSYLCAVPRPTDQPLTTLSASKHDRPTDQRAVVGDFGWQLSKNPRRSAQQAAR